MTFGMEDDDAEVGGVSEMCVGEDGVAAASSPTSVFFFGGIFDFALAIVPRRERNFMVGIIVSKMNESSTGNYRQ